MVENLSKRREPLPTLSGVYFITPTESSLNELISDFRTKPLYKTAHVFFSTRVDARTLAAFRSRAPATLLSCLKSLKEVSSTLVGSACLFVPHRPLPVLQQCVRAAIMQALPTNHCVFVSCCHVDWSFMPISCT